jgi:hypothetical protein
MIHRGAALLALFIAAASPLAAAEPERLDIPTFAVELTDREGAPRESFSRSSPPHFTVSFALALSASPRYATRITLVHVTAEGGEESVLFEGNLEDGFYRFTVPAPLVEGEATARIILKTRVFPKKFTGESYYVYRIWEGTYYTGR